ncbi:MAG TPA: ankyrin repeat domain-containing protein, partial [Planctomycetota bacterium]|nr:ankyrin repeat domain-containing protein [Planctomycetota bacterium]
MLPKLHDRAHAVVGIAVAAWAAGCSAGPKDGTVRREGEPTALMQATIRGDAKSVESLLDRGADPNLADGSGATALLWAVGDLEKTRLLLDHGADVRAQTRFGVTPLIAAASRDDGYDVVRLLLDRGADVAAAADGFGALGAAAAESEDPRLIRLLLERGADASARVERSHWTPIQGAALAADPRSVADLLDRGADPNASDTLGGRTALIWAAVAGRSDVVGRLLARGASAGVQESFSGTTPLICAAASDRSGADACVAALLESGADPNVHDHRGDSALTWALRRGGVAVAESLRRHGAELGTSAPAEEPARRNPPASTLEAVRRSLPLLQSSADTFLSAVGSSCISCHHQALPAMTLGLAAERGVGFDRERAQRQADAMLRVFSERKAKILVGAGLPDHLDAAYALAGLEAAGIEPCEVTDALVHYLCA